MAYFAGFDKGQKASKRDELPEVINAEATSFDDALEGSSRDRLVPVDGDNDLPAIGVTPFLMTTLLTGQDKSVSAQLRVTSRAFRTGKWGLTETKLQAVSRPRQV
jgi:hypothetical protein